MPNISPPLSASRLFRNSIPPTPPAHVDTFDSTLGKLTDNDLQFISATRMQELISARHNTPTTSGLSNTSRTLEFTTPPPSTTTVTSIQPPKIDMICSPSPVGCTYNGPLDFLDN